MKFTKEEIELCRKIAERYRKERLEKGDWYILKLIHGKEQIRLHSNENPWIINTKDYIPLWTLSDCLEWLRGKGCRLSGHYDIADEIMISFSAATDSAMEKLPEVFDKGRTDLEVCLKIVLAVLEEEQ